MEFAGQKIEINTDPRTGSILLVDRVIQIRTIIGKKIESLLLRCYQYIFLNHFYPKLPEI